LTVGGFAIPQEGHACASEDPHSPQNLRPASLAAAQEGQSSSSLTRQLYCAYPALPRPGRRYAHAVLLDTTQDEHELSPDRAWWLRVPAVILSPRPVFFALRDEDPDDVSARSEPILLLIWLAGAASVLASPTAATLLDKDEWDGPLLAVWAFAMGGIYGAAGYFVLGFAIFFGARLFGSLGDFRRERQLVGFALAPLALSLLVLLPLRLALYGADTFREGGRDEGAGEAVLLSLQLGFAAWSLGLLVLGVRVVHGWNWLRSTAVVLAAAALLAAIVGVFAL
jgi:hypothetical protein